MQIDIRDNPMPLPNDSRLPVYRLASVFNNTTATYKFYWFISLLDAVVKENKRVVSFWEIIAGMLAESWYPIHYFKLSFGKSDSLFVQSKALQQMLNIPIDADKDRIKSLLIENVGNQRVKSCLRVFSLNVPYRFLSPWFTYTTDADVVRQSQLFHNQCLYAIRGEMIETNPMWIDYLCEHYAILSGFAFWNLTLFLQKRNPNVPDVPSKLIKPIQRDSLTRQHRFWDAYISSVGSIRCIYTDKPLYPKSYDLDHFIPWSFVSHNLLWNLLPADSSINSSKSNNLPSLDAYLRPFTNLHHEALKSLYPLKPNDKIFEDYLTIYDSVPELIKLSEVDFCNVFRKTLSPMVQIAENMGFQTWNKQIN